MRVYDQLILAARAKERITFLSLIFLSSLIIERINSTADNNNLKWELNKIKRIGHCITLYAKKVSKLKKCDAVADFTSLIDFSNKKIYIYSNLVISNSLISNYRLSRSENLVPVLT